MATPSRGPKQANTKKKKKEKKGGVGWESLIPPNCDSSGEGCQTVGRFPRSSSTRSPPAQHHLPPSPLSSRSFVCVTLKLNNTVTAARAARLHLFSSSASPSTTHSHLLLLLLLLLLHSPSLSLSPVHFSPVRAQGSWSRAMLSQQQRDADGRAAQSGINAHWRALHS